MRSRRNLEDGRRFIAECSSLYDLEALNELTCQLDHTNISEKVSASLTIFDRSIHSIDAGVFPHHIL